MRKTKIICTIGPVTESIEMLEKLATAGMNIARLNMSHGSHESHAKIIESIKQLNTKLDHPVAILLDTQGPEIRTGDMVNDLHLNEGDTISIVARGAENVEESSIHVNYDDLINDVDIGDTITVDNGLINLQVLEKQDRMMQVKVIDGGLLKSKRHVNLPGIRVNLPAITDKDRRDIEFTKNPMLLCCPARQLLASTQSSVWKCWIESLALPKVAEVFCSPTIWKSMKTNNR